MDTGARIAVTLGSIDDSESREAGVLSFKDVATDNKVHKVLHLSDSVNGFVPVKTPTTDKVEDVLNNIISRPQKDDVFVVEFDKEYESEVGQVVTNTIVTPSYYRRVIIDFRTWINGSDVVNPLNKLEDGWAEIKVVDKRGAKVLERKWNFYNMTGGDYKQWMEIGSDEDPLLIDETFQEPVKITFKYSIPLGQFAGKTPGGEVRPMTCIRRFKTSFTAKRVTTDSELHDPSLQFMCKFDPSGNYTYTGTDVIDQFKKDYRENYDKYKPYILEVKKDGVRHKVIPYMSEHCVFTELTFENENFRDVGKLVEKMMKVLVRDQNNIFVRANKVYTETTKFIKAHLELNAQQEVKLLDIWAAIADFWSQVLNIEEWLPKTDILKPKPKIQELDLTRFESTRMYKYRVVPDKTALLSDSDTDHWEPVLWFHALSPTDDSQMHGMCSSTGQLMHGYINKSEVTDYIRREVRQNEVLATGGAYNQQFVSDPLSPKEFTGPMMGDADNLYRTLNGTVVCRRRADVPTDAYRTTPWIQVQIECYNTIGVLQKTINAVFENSGSNRQPVNFNGQDLTFKWNATLGGAYRYKYKLLVYWGTFTAWTDEIKLSYVTAGGSNNSGGRYSINTLLFNGQRNRILTRCQLHGASKYEKNVIINGRGYGWGGKVNPPIDWSNNGTFEVPGSANHWDASFYGIIYEEPGCDFVCKDWGTKQWNYWVSGTRDERDKLHYGGGQAEKLSIMTNLSMTITGIGDKAYYIPDIYKTPSFYFPEDGSYTFMVRGARRYQFISSLPTKLLQHGTFEVVVGTYDMTLSNTNHYGINYVKEDDIIIRGNKSNYKINIAGHPDSESIINSGAPSRSARTELVRKKRSLRTSTDKPYSEHGVGELTIVPIPYGHLFHDGQNHDIYLVITDKNGNKLSIDIPPFDFKEYQLIYRTSTERAYMRIEGSYVWIMTYGINVLRMEFFSRVISNLEFQLIDVVTKDVAESIPLMREKTSETSLAFEVGGKEYYINLSTEPPKTDAEPVKILDKDNRIVGYLSK